jgi:cytoskeletal protein CcmA (bactofilin family)
MRIRDLIGVMMAPRRRFAAALMIAVCGCAQVDVVAVPHGDTIRTPDAAMSDAHVGVRDAQVADTGPRPRDSSVADATDATDATTAPPPCMYGAADDPIAANPVLALAALAHAICTCDSITSSDTLTTDAAQSALRGDVGVNGQMSVEAASTIGGGLTVAGGSGLHIGDDIELTVAGDLQVEGPLEGTLASARVAQDARVGGRIDLSALFVTGTLTQPAGAERRITGTAEFGDEVSQDVVVTPPCDCGQAALFDPSAFVSAHAAMAMSFVDAGTTAGRCAAYALADGEADAIDIALHESAAVFVPGDLHVTGDLHIDAEAGAVVDLFVAGDVRIDGRVRIGSGDGQGPVRIYVGGAGTVQISGGGALHGVLYAPKAELVLAAPLEVHGALFMRRIAAAAALDVHHDRF